MSEVLPSSAVFRALQLPNHRDPSQPLSPLLVYSSVLGGSQRRVHCVGAMVSGSSLMIHLISELLGLAPGLGLMLMRFSDLESVRWTLSSIGLLPLLRSARRLVSWLVVAIAEWPGLLVIHWGGPGTHVVTGLRQILEGPGKPPPLWRLHKSRLQTQGRGGSRRFSASFCAGRKLGRFRVPSFIAYTSVVSVLCSHCPVNVWSLVVSGQWGGGIWCLFLHVYGGPRMLAWV